MSGQRDNHSFEEQVFKIGTREERIDTLCTLVEEYAAKSADLKGAIATALDALLTTFVRDLVVQTIWWTTPEEALVRANVVAYHVLADVRVDANLLAVLGMAAEEISTMKSGGPSSITLSNAYAKGLGG